jgi:PST family polysaccharide transporter
LGITILLLSARTYFLPYFPLQLSWLGLFIVGAFLLVLQSFFNAVLMAQQKTGKLILANIFSALAVVGYVAFAAGKLPVALFLIGYLLVMGVMGISIWPFSLRGLPKKQLFKLQISSEALKSLSKYILMAASVMLFSKGLEYYIRDYLIRHFTMEQTGLWQGVVRITDSYTTLYAAVLAFAFYPKVATLLQQEQKLNLFVRQTFLLLIPVIFVGLSLVYFFQDYFFTWLLSARFKSAGEFLPFQLAGDFCKLLSWLLANILVAQAKFKISILFEAISALFYFGFFHLFTSIYHLAGSPMAHFAHYFIFLLLNVFYFRKLLTA